MLEHSVGPCLLNLCLPLHSWGTKVDCVHLCLAGSDCLPLPYCSEDPWDIAFCSSHRQVSQCVFSANLCWVFVVFNPSLLTNTDILLIFPRYLIFVMCVTTLIATNQIVVLNFSLRSPSTHTMSHTIKRVSRSCVVGSNVSIQELFCVN